ncbi:AraC family transcriptional regulator [uncultured Tateyamaria sp.]|uniref:helix-turn-helix domain-containing protein n=1 Tax=uncultured Tateyamaria sp. TaxID=455651 RepID=UPI002631A1EA|nr:AraC family transcriptional regulator [uncultured Tateyamaria sp.]
MIYLDLALRGGGITLLLLLAFLLWRAPIGLEGRVAVTALAISKAAFLITTAAIPLDLPPLVLSNITFLSVLTPAAITWLIVSIFLDPPWWRWPWIAAGLATSGALYAHTMFPETTPYCLTMGVGLYGALFLLALWSARDDLVECRCRARPGFASAIAGLALFLTGAQAVGALEEGTVVLALFQAIGVFAVTLAFAIWLLRPDADRWPGEQEPVADTARPSPEDALDAALIARINAAMAGGIWREEGLTIGALANSLAVPEHRLRRAINQGLGHRNFSSFINRARIDAARTTLQDPARMNTTVLEIAYDVGFASVGPFNRAFRAEVGQSPTEYRRAAMSGTFADSENSAPIVANLH